MATNRMIRDWTDSETIQQLSVEAEVFFTRLIMKVDDYGNYTTNLKLINANLFPLKDYSTTQIELWLKELYLHGIIGYYQADSKTYLHIVDFGQKKRRMKSDYPPPPDGQVRTHNGQVSDKCRTSADKCPPELEEEEEVEAEVEVEAEARPRVSDNIRQDFENVWAAAFDQRWITEGAKMKYPGLNIEAELADYRFKCDSAPMEYHCRDRDGLRLGFIAQLRAVKNRPNSKKFSKEKIFT